MPRHPADRLARAIRGRGSPACVGIDPVIESIPMDVRARHHEPVAAIAEFTRGILDAVGEVVPAVKFQSACFERYGSRGVALLEEVMGEASRAGLVVVLDAKRGDIGISSAHYAAAAGRAHAHFVTVSGYLGMSGVTPFLDAGLGVFVLVRTSNPDSDEIQGPRLADGRSVAELVADEVARLGSAHAGEEGLSAVGAVVGATKAADAQALRGRMPDQVFLIPGYGAQGGTAADIRRMRRPAHDPARWGILVTASRSVIYAPAKGGERWTDAVREAARRFAGEIAG